MLRFVRDVYLEDNETTIGAAFLTKTVHVDNALSGGFCALPTRSPPTRYTAAFKRVHQWAEVAGSATYHSPSPHMPVPSPGGVQ